MSRVAVTLDHEHPLARPLSVPHDTHWHLWTLADGTLSHAPPGELTTNADGRLACHLCGRWFVHLGSHLRRHGWSPDAYREAVGLPLHVPLCSTELSGRIARRQRAAWTTSEEVRARFEPGIAMARSGDLAARARSSNRVRRRQGRIPAAQVAAQRVALDRGRRTAEERRRARLDASVAAAGARDLPAYLRSAYAAGASLEELARVTGLGRARLRTALTGAGVEVRPAGVNRLASKQRRAVRNDAVVAADLGCSDVRVWLVDRRRDGASLRTLAAETGRSIPWVRSRLRDSGAPGAMTG